jgi:hypothetical protein
VEECVDADLRPNVQDSPRGLEATMSRIAANFGRATAGTAILYPR